MLHRKGRVLRRRKGQQLSSVGIVLPGAITGVVQGDEQHAKLLRILEGVRIVHSSTPRSTVGVLGMGSAMDRRETRPADLTAEPGERRARRVSSLWRSVPRRIHFEPMVVGSSLGRTQAIDGRSAAALGNVLGPGTDGSRWVARALDSSSAAGACGWSSIARLR